MKITSLFLFALIFCLHAENTNSQNVKVTIKQKNADLENVLNSIENQTDYLFVYNKYVNVNRKVSLDLNKSNLEEVLNHLFKGTDVKYTVDGKYIILSPRQESEVTAQQIAQQGRTVTGVVKDTKGDPVIGANVIEAGTTNGTVTDLDGVFNINVQPGATLQISYIGYLSQNIKIGKDTQLSIVIQEDNQALEEVVVIGYGTQKKVNLTGSVASVSSEQIADVPVGSLSSALSGRVSGVLVSQTGGKPGAGASITVRAQGTWNNVEPLYVIDGVVRDKFAFDGLDANDVEGLSVLKDGASAAIYGSRAANGVVLVTTKKGKDGKPVISYTGSIGFSDATKIPERQNAYNQAIFINDNLQVENVDHSDNRYYTPDELDYFKNNSYDWLDEAWKQPLVTRHSVNVSGGNSNVRYYVGGSYFYETGSFNNLSFKKYNLRSNIEANITKNLIASLNMNMDMRNDDKPYWRYDDDRETMSNLYRGLLFRTGQVAPYVDGKPTGTYVEWHPIEQLQDHTGYNRKKYSNYEASIALQYNVPFVKGLSAKLMFNKYNRQTFIKQFSRPYSLYEFKMKGEHNHIITNEVDRIKVRNDGDRLIEKYESDNNYQFNAYLTYANTFGKHNIGALLVYEQSEGELDWFNGQRNYFISSAIDQMFAGSSDSKNSTVDGRGSETGRISYVGRFNYGYDEKYLLEASFRYDGSVNFAPNHRWGFFPSASAAWRMSEEPFFKNNVRFVDYLKLRASVGLLGNDAVDGWQWMQRYKFVDGAQFGGLTSGIETDVLSNPNITWEKSLSYNIGLDTKFLNNKLTFNFDAFYRKTYDILASREASLPTSFGATMPKENYAKIDAKGFEIELGYEDKIGKDFTYYVKGNMGYAVNKVIQKDQPQNQRAYKSEIGYNIDRKMGYYATDIIRTQNDLDALPKDYTIFGQKPELGMLNYRDLRGANSDTPDGKIDEFDQDWIINHTTPPINYGFTLGAAWKGLALDVFFQGVAGSDIMYDYRGAQARPQEINFDFWTDHWTPENIDAAYPRASRSNSDQESTFWIRNGSFLRLKDLSLSYSLPKSLLAKSNISQLKFFFVGTNLFLLQDHVKVYDPESTDYNPDEPTDPRYSSIMAYPMMKSYSFGVNLSF